MPLARATRANACNEIEAGQCAYLNYRHLLQNLYAPLLFLKSIVEVVSKPQVAFESPAIIGAVFRFC
jgi:hypothetical protein